MQFKPKTQAELDAAQLLTKGEYDAEILEGEDTKSKTSGNDMIKLKVGVFRPDGSQKWINDYLTAEGYNLPALCRAVGLWDAYTAGELDATYLVGRTMRVVVGIEPAKGEYKAKNKITDYLGVEKVVATAGPITSQPPEDDIPF